jgi:hypothetical protein
MPPDQHGHTEGEGDPGKANSQTSAASTALPHPRNTSQNIPKNSAAARFPMLITRLLKLELGRLAGT